MGEALRKMRRKGLHKNLEAENIELRKAFDGMRSVVGQLHMTMLRFAVGSNWVCRIKTRRSGWFWQRRVESIPEYIWLGAGNPEKAAHDVMEACFSKNYQEQARAVIAAMRKKQEEVNEKIDVSSLPESTSATLTPGRRE